MRNLAYCHRFFFTPAVILKVSRPAIRAALAFSAALLCAYPALAQSDFETAGDILVQGDFDGDLKLDYAFWRPSTGTWYVYQSSSGQLITQQWGVLDDVPIPGDYDGDGRTDFAVWRPSDGTWYVLPSSSPGSQLVQRWGLPEDIPVRGEFVSTTRTDYVVWRPSEGNWYVLTSDGTTSFTVQFGLPGDIPVPGHFSTTNPLTDFAVWRPSDGSWHILPSNGAKPTTVTFGLPGDVPVPGDYDGDGITDYAVWRPLEGTVFISPSTNPATVYTQQLTSPANILATRFDVGGLGAGVYIHVNGDFDGDGTPDFALWRPLDGEWFVVPSSAPAAPIIQQFGLAGDVPVPGAFSTPQGATDFAVWRPSEGNWYSMPNGGTLSTVQWGMAGDIPVVGDFDGDGLADHAVWRPSDGNWYVLPSDTSLPSYVQPWGLVGDIPVPGNYSGSVNGTTGFPTTDYAVFRPTEGNWYVQPNDPVNPSFVKPWGLPGDVPISGDFDGDGLTDFGIWRPSDANLWVLPNNTASSYYVQGVGIAGSVPVVYGEPPIPPFVAAAVGRNRETRKTEGRVSRGRLPASRPDW